MRVIVGFSITLMQQQQQEYYYFIIKKKMDKRRTQDNMLRVYKLKKRIKK